MKKKTTAKRAAAKKSLSRRGSVAIDTVPLPEKVLGMTVKSGKVTKLRDKYMLTVGRRKMELAVGTLVTKTEAGKLVGKNVKVAYSKTRPSSIVAIGTWPTPERPTMACFWITCYIPGPDVLRKIQDSIRMTLVNKYVNEGIITPKLKDLIKSSAVQ